MKKNLVTLFCLGLIVCAARAQQPPPRKVIDPLSMQWPRVFEDAGYEYAVYQPQINKWPGNHLSGQFAMAVRPAGTSNETYGAVIFTARTEIDKANRLVTLEDFQITKMNFPTKRNLQKRFETAIQKHLPETAKTIPLDHLEAVLAASADVIKAKAVAVKNDPPRILYATQPSLLINVEGDPILKPLVGDYDRVINTRAILLFNSSLQYKAYFLHAAGYWYTSPSLEGPWAVSTIPPSDINTALEAALKTKQVDPMQPTAPLTKPPVVYVATTATELLESAGVADLLPIAGTDLLYVSNSSNAIFYYLDDAHYYVLISGRWFKSAALTGPWTYVVLGTLPADFAKIPPTHPKSNVLCSVPGTPQAQESAIANAIPQTATVYRDQAKATVEYAGTPTFVPIPGTTLVYASNTTTPVIRLNDYTYYACQGGIWFIGTSAYGPWVVATSVPPVIYSIPPSCPIYYVTYCYVYGYTPGVVYVGYTPGYMGTVVASGGVVVYGTGYYYAPVVVGTTYVSYPPTYGYGASFALGMACGFAFGYCAGSSSSCCCEPYWGPYYYAYPYSYSYAHVNVNSYNYYNHWGASVHTTSTSGYNAYTGNEWAGQHASSYNPYTGTSATGSRGAAGNVYTGNYAAGKQGAAYNPNTGMYAAGQKGVVGNAYNGTASTANRGVVGNTQTGNAVAWNNGNVYADHDGNVYKSTGSGSVQQYNSSSGKWQTPTTTPRPTSTSTTAPTSRPTPSSSWNSWASRESTAQSTGSDRFSNWSHSDSGGGFSGGGGDGFHGGGGFRR